MGRHFPTFDEARPTVRDLAHQTVNLNNFHPSVVAELPDELAARVLTDATLLETTRAIDQVRFAATDRLKAAVDTDDGAVLARLLSNPEASKGTTDEVQELVEKVRFLATLGQTVLHQ